MTKPIVQVSSREGKTFERAHAQRPSPQATFDRVRNESGHTFASMCKSTTTASRVGLHARKYLRNISKEISTSIESR